MGVRVAIALARKDVRCWFLRMGLLGRKCQETEENCAVRSFVSGTPHMVTYVIWVSAVCGGLISSDPSVRMLQPVAAARAVVRPAKFMQQVAGGSTPGKCRWSLYSSPRRDRVCGLKTAEDQSAELMWSHSSVSYCITQRTKSLTLAPAQKIWIYRSFTVHFLYPLPPKVPINHAKDKSCIIWVCREALRRKFELALSHFLCSHYIS